MCRLDVLAASVCLGERLAAVHGSRAWPPGLHVTAVVYVLCSIPARCGQVAVQVMGAITAPCVVPSAVGPALRDAHAQGPTVGCSRHRLPVPTATSLAVATRHRRASWLPVQCRVALVQHPQPRAGYMCTAGMHVDLLQGHKLVLSASHACAGFCGFCCRGTVLGGIRMCMHAWLWWHQHMRASSQAPR